MLIVEIDDFNAEATQARFAALADVRGLAVDAQELAISAANVAELGREDHLVAASLNGARDELLVAADAVDVRRIEKVDAELERPVDRRNRLGLVAAAVEIGHAHAAEAHRRHFKPGAQCSVFHVSPRYP